MEEKKKNIWKITVYLTAYLVLIATALANAQTPDTIRTEKRIIEEQTIKYDTTTNDVINQYNYESKTQTETIQTPTVAATPPSTPAQTPTQPANEEAHNDLPPLRHVEFGIRYMPLISAVTLRSSNGTVYGEQIAVSHGFGAMLGINFTKHWGLVGEANYYEVTQTYNDMYGDHTVNLGYVNIPVMLAFNTNKKRAVNLNLVAGPQFGFNMRADIDTKRYGETETLTASVATKQNDVGLAYGAGLEFALNKARTFRLDLGYRGFYGLFDTGAKQVSNNPDTYYIYVKGARKAQGGYLGFTWAF